MGPLASAEFLKTIYECSGGESEQDFPLVVLLSDPTFPDRTDAFLAGDYDVVLQRLIESLHSLCNLGASKIVLCCMTIHYLLPRLPVELRSKIVSLLDVVFSNIGRTEKQHLLICSNGTRKLGLFQNHEQWELSRNYIVLPDERDQQRIHRDLIYPIKKNPDLHELFPYLDFLLKKYKVSSFIAGCSEIHLLGKYVTCSGRTHMGYSCLDPLAIIAKEVAEQYSSGAI